MSWQGSDVVKAVQEESNNLTGRRGVVCHVRQGGLRHPGFNLVWLPNTVKQRHGGRVECKLAGSGLSRISEITASSDENMFCSWCCGSGYGEAVDDVPETHTPEELVRDGVADKMLKPWELAEIMLSHKKFADALA